MQRATLGIVGANERQCAKACDRRTAADARATRVDGVGRCAELCGAYHSKMLFNVEVVSAEEYDRRLQELADKDQTGEAVGGADADTQVGIEEEVQDDDTSSEESQ